MPSRECRCGSGLTHHALYDARGIFVSYVCTKCEPSVRDRYRADIFTDADYWTDEEVEGDPVADPWLCDHKHDLVAIGNGFHRCIHCGEKFFDE